MTEKLKRSERKSKKHTKRLEEAKVRRQMEFSVRHYSNKEEVEKMYALIEIRDLNNDISEKIGRKGALISSSFTGLAAISILAQVGGVFEYGTEAYIVLMSLWLVTVLYTFYQTKNTRDVANQAKKEFLSCIRDIQGIHRAEEIVNNEEHFLEVANDFITQEHLLLNDEAIFRSKMQNSIQPEQIVEEETLLDLLKRKRTILQIEDDKNQESL